MGQTEQSDIASKKSGKLISLTIEGELRRQLTFSYNIWKTKGTA